MTMLTDAPVVREPEASSDAGLPEPPHVEVPVERRPSKGRWPWIAVAVLAAILVGAGFWWFMNPTVSEGKYDDAIAEAEATGEALAAAQADVGRLEAEVAQLEGEVGSLTADYQASADAVASLRAAVAAALPPAEAAALYGVWFDPGFASELEAAGADLTYADQVLADLGRAETFKQWTVERTAGDPWFSVDRAMGEPDDDPLWIAWTKWNAAEVGSMQEQVASWEMMWRLSHLVLQPLVEAGALP